MELEEMVEIDLDGKAVAVPRDVVNAIAAAAAARAGVSERHRDLSLHLVRALESGRASLDRGDVRALVAVLEEDHPDRFGPAAGDLRRALAA
jgi:ABC-type amino acid transport substrate-binding protein